MELDKKKAKKLGAMGGMILATTVVFLSVFHLLLGNPLLLASFSSSVFAIIAIREIRYPPTHVVVGSHLIAAFVGFALSFVTVASYPSVLQSFFFPINGAFAVAVASVLMIRFKVQHAPAAATALSFSYNLSGASSLTTFMIVLVMIGAIGLVKWVWISLARIVKALEDEVVLVEKRVEGGVESLEDEIMHHKKKNK